MKEIREKADERARLAIIRTEKALVDALDGETLRGLPDLGLRTFGLRVDKEGSSLAQLPKDRPILIVDSKGRLRVATRFATSIMSRSPHWPEVTASTLEPYLRAVNRAIEMHVKSSGKRRGSFEQISEIAARCLTDFGPA